VWRLHKLPGITVPAGRPCPRARLRFDRITQPWLRELAKRWTRLRLASGLSIGAAYSGVDALTSFSQFLTLIGVDALADVDRPLLERHLAYVTSQSGSAGTKKTRIGGLNLFFQAIRQNGWDDTLPGTAAFYPGDIPSVSEQVDRRLAEYVMTQIEAPANLDRWPDRAGRAAREEGAPWVSWRRQSKPRARALEIRRPSANHPRTSPQCRRTAGR
jgi:hypothetical protein